jgi:hypothetical protein
VIRLNEFLCPDLAPRWENYIGGHPVFVVTANTDQPVFLTKIVVLSPTSPPTGQQWIGPPAIDVDVTVRSWNVGGQPEPNIPFDWIAITASAQAGNF